MKHLTYPQFLSLIFLLFLIFLLPIVLISNQKQKQLLSKAEEKLIALNATPSATMSQTIPSPSSIPTATRIPTPLFTVTPTPIQPTETETETLTSKTPTLTPPIALPTSTLISLPTITSLPTLITPTLFPLPTLTVIPTQTQIKSLIPSPTSGTFFDPVTIANPFVTTPRSLPSSVNMAPTPIPYTQEKTIIDKVIEAMTVSFNELFTGDKKRQKTIDLFEQYKKANEEGKKNIFPTLIKSTQNKVANISGIVDIYHSDDFKNKKSYEEFIFTDNQTGKQSKLYFAPDSQEIFLSGTEINIKEGISIDEKMREELNPSEIEGSGSPNNTEDLTTISNLVSVSFQFISKPVSGEALGNQSVLVLLVKKAKTETTSNQLPKPSEIKARINSVMKPFYEKNSHENFSFNVSMPNKWYLLPEKREVVLFETEGMENIIAQAFEDSIQVDKYERIIFISATQVGYRLNWASLGKAQIHIKKRKFLIFHKNYKFKAAIAFITFPDPDSEYFWSFLRETFRHSNDGDFSEFDNIVIHEFGHGLGLGHANTMLAVTTGDPEFTVFPKPVPFNYECENGNIYSKNFYNPKSDPLVLWGDKLCLWNEYGNHFDVMGNGARGMQFNSRTKKFLRWIGDKSSGKILKVSIQNPYGEYELKERGEAGTVALWLPFFTDTQDRSHIDYFIEYVNNSFYHSSGLSFTLGKGTNIDKYFVGKNTTMSITYIPAKRIDFSNYFPSGSEMKDLVNKVKITVKEEDINRKTIRFRIDPL